MSKITDKFKTTYYKVIDKAHCERLQKLMFKLGFRWTATAAGSRRELHALYAGHLYVDKFCRIIWSDRFYTPSSETDENDTTYSMRTENDLKMAVVAHKEAQKTKRKAKRAFKAGWISWNGGVQPVEDGTLIDVRYRRASVYANDGVNLSLSVKAGDPGVRGTFWTNDNAFNDIVAYRIVKSKTQGKIVSFSDMVEDIVESAGGEERVPVKPDTNPKRQYGLKSIPLNLWSPLASAYGAVGLYNGSLKYGQGNYKATPVEASIYIAAGLRHFLAWAEGQECDPADGVPNLAGVLANVAILLDARAAGTLIDDRQLPGGYLKEIEALKEIVGKLQLLHAGKTPRHYSIADVK